MKKVSATILLPNEERLLLLVQWMEKNSTRLPFAELVDACIEAKIRASVPRIEESAIEDSVSDTSHEILWGAVPFCDLHYQYDDYWRIILEEWLQDGWFTLMGHSGDTEPYIEEFMETMEIRRINDSIWNANPPSDHERLLVRDFLLEWRQRAFKELIKYLRK